MSVFAMLSALRLSVSNRICLCLSLKSQQALETVILFVYWCRNVQAFSDQTHSIVSFLFSFLFSSQFSFIGVCVTSLILFTLNFYLIFIHLLFEAFLHSLNLFFLFCFPSVAEQNNCPFCFFFVFLI